MKGVNVSSFGDLQRIKMGAALWINWRSLVDCGAWIFDCSTFRVSRFARAGMSLEQMILITALKFPASNLFMMGVPFTYAFVDDVA